MSFVRPYLMGLLILGILFLAGACDDTGSDTVYFECTHGESPPYSEVDFDEVALSWQYDGENPTYRVVYYAEPEDADTLPETSEPADTLWNLQPYRAYHWFVQVYKSGELVCEGSESVFLTGGWGCFLHAEWPSWWPTHSTETLVLTDTVTLRGYPHRTLVATSFRIRLGLDPLTMEYVSDYSSEPEAQVSGLLPDNRYYWQVEAYDGDGLVCAGVIFTFRTARLEPPYAPVPADGATGVPTRPLLSWSFDVPAGMTFHYDVHIETVGGAQYTLRELTETEGAPPTLLEGHAYEWYVVAYSTDGDTLVGDTWSFTTTAVQPEDIYAQFMVETQWFDQWMFYDFARARFDSVYNPNDTVKPLQATSVMFEQWEMYWSTYSKQYDYTPMLTPGQTYTFYVEASAAVPAAEISIQHPACRPQITLPEATDTVGFDGFAVEWDNTCGGDVIITMLKGADSTGVRVVTSNDGAYSMTASDLNPLNSTEGYYTIVIILQNQEMIDNVSGYDPRSTITARFYNEMWIYME